MGVCVIAAATVGFVMVAVIATSFDLKTAVLMVLGLLGAWALGAGFINGWRTPLLVVRPDALTIPTFFGARDIPISPSHPMGEYLASSRHSSRNGTIEGNKFVHFFTLDAAGTLTQVAAMHRDAPMIADIRRALTDVAGLKIETLKVNQKKKTRPDVSHWKK